MCFCCCHISSLKGVYTHCLLYYFFATLIFNGWWAKAKVVFRKTSGICNCYLENGFAKFSFWFDVSSKLIRWNAWDEFWYQIQICEVKAVWTLLGYLFCFKVTDQIKYSINESLITFDTGQWILIWNPMSLWDVSSASGSLTVARGRHGHF